MGEKTSEYPVDHTTFNDDDLFDVSAYVSPGAWQTRKYTWAEIKSKFIPLAGTAPSAPVNGDIEVFKPMFKFGDINSIAGGTSFVLNYDESQFGLWNESRGFLFGWSAGQFYIDNGTKTLAIDLGNFTDNHTYKAPDIDGIIGTDYNPFNGVPSINEDSTKGYVNNKSILRDYNTQKEYLCTDNTVGAAVWTEIIAAPPTWGSITGTLSEQTDLQTELDNRPIRNIYVVSGTVEPTASTIATENIYIFDGAGSLRLPDAIGNQATYKVKNYHNANISVLFSESQNADGSTTIDLIPNQALEFISNNANYNIF